MSEPAVVPTVLAINPGSSSLKVALRSERLLLTASVSRINDPDAVLEVTGDGGTVRLPAGVDIPAAIGTLAVELGRRGLFPDAVAHRVVHGGPDHYLPTFVSDRLLADLRATIPLAPLHLPADIASIERARSLWPVATHVACFDTGFHHDLPETDIRLPIAGELAARGIRRYGFHGLSMQSVLHAVPDLGPAVVAHLGSGCSVTAIASGRPLHTTMSLTPTGGMVSATRSGDLDPEVVLTLLEHEGYTSAQLRNLLERGSGLAGVAGSGRSDLRDLLSADDDNARLALGIFVRSAAMAIAAAATTLHDWQALVFTGGMGQNAAVLRERICAQLLALRGRRYSDGGSDPVEALRATKLRVLVVAADEEGVMDRLTRPLLTAVTPAVSASFPA